MSTHTFKSQAEKVKTPQDYIAELVALVGANFPLAIETSTIDGSLTNITFESTWKEGGTKPIEEEYIDENGEKKYRLAYVGEYEEKHLTAEQIAKLEQWAAQNLASQ